MVICFLALEHDDKLPRFKSTYWCGGFSQLQCSRLRALEGHVCLCNMQMPCLFCLIVTILNCRLMQGTLQGCFSVSQLDCWPGLMQTGMPFYPCIQCWVGDELLTLYNQRPSIVASYM